MKLRKLFVFPNQQKNKLELHAEFDLPGGKYQHYILFIEDFIGDTRDELADSLQVWVDSLREPKP